MDLEWSDWGTPDVVPIRSDYEATNDTVRDLKTGLLWQRSTAPMPLGWGDASRYCGDLVLAGSEDWRLPTLIELVSIVNYGRADPAIDTSLFASAPSDTAWTTSPGSYAMAYRTVSLREGWTGTNPPTYMHTVRCIERRLRGDPPGATGGAPQGRFERGAEAVRDTMTGLTWQRATSSSRHAASGAEQYCRDLEADGKTDWRLPTVKELQTLVDVRVQDPSIDRDAFPNTPAAWFWTSTPRVLPAGVIGPDHLWTVVFDRGDTSSAKAADSYNSIRCVRSTNGS